MYVFSYLSWKIRYKISFIFKSSPKQTKKKKLKKGKHFKSTIFKEIHEYFIGC